MKILRYPHPALRYPAAPVRHLDKRMRTRIGEMFELMYEAHGIGLAANQVGIPAQLIVANPSGDPTNKDAERVYLNPTITRRQGIIEAGEGCLSFPGLSAKVKRARRVEVAAFDVDGRQERIVADGIEARLWQHELDHLNGVLFIDRFAELVRLARRHDIRAFEEAFRRAQQRGEIAPDAELKAVLDALVRESQSE